MTLRKFRDALIVMGVFLGVIWVLQVVNWAVGYRLDTELGILPEHVSRLPEIFTAPFLHFSWEHIEGNSAPLFVLGVLAAYRSISRFLLVSLIIVVTSGLAVWFFQAGNELTVGASGVIFGYFGYVLMRGFFDRSLTDIVVGLVAGALYWTILEVALPGTPGVSWIGHAGGLVGGVLAAWVMRTPATARVTAGRVPAAGGPARATGRTSPGGRTSPSSPSPSPSTRRDKSVEAMLRELKKEQGL
jgi:membrane associated rhomboid family serine protease